MVTKGTIPLFGGFRQETMFIVFNRLTIKDLSDYMLTCLTMNRVQIVIVRTSEILIYTILLN